MKFSKRIGLVVIVVPLLTIATLFFSAHQALAAVCKSGGTCSFTGEPFNSTFSLQNSQITTTIAKGSSQAQQLTFTFTGTSGNTETYTSTDKIFCSASQPTPAAAATITMGLPPYGQNINATLHAYYFNGSGCKSNDSNKSITVANNDTSTGGGGGGGTGGSQGLPKTLTYNGQSYTLVQPGIPLYGITNDLTKDCYGGSVLVANAGVTSGAVYSGLQYNTNGGLASLSNAVNSNGLLTQDVGPLINGCGFPSSATPGGTTGTIANGVFSAQTSAQVDCAANPNDSSCTSPNSCETEYTGAAKEFNWIFCAALRGIDGIVGFLDGQIQGYLFLCTGQSQTTGETCSNNLLPSHVYQVWSTFRILASALLVIIMLVMVVAQAMGGAGPIDAYTVRKVLPRLLIAAIFMQVSWYAFKFVIDVSNDVGRGIADLMFYPFGGAGNFSLDNLIGGTGRFGAGVTITAASVTTGALIAFSGLTALGWVFLGVTMMASLFTGMLVLVIRQLIVILCMMVAPLALAAWILPGTKRYWDMWKDNFFKVLLMFPLIMAMIAGGRIFAYLGSQQRGFTGLIIVLVGYFFPYFYLPKTFKWGGQAFGAIAGATWQGTQKYRAAPGKYALGQAKIERERRAQDRNARIAEGRSDHPRFDQLLAGRNNLLLSRTTRLRRFETNRAKGREEAEKQHALSVTGSEFENLDHQQKIEDLEDRARQRIGRHTGIDGSDPVAARYALDELAKYGDWDRINRIFNSGDVDSRVWQAFIAKNISAIHQNLPHLSPQRRDLSVLAPEEAVTWKDDAQREALRLAETYQVRNPDGSIRTVTDPEEREALRLRYVNQSRTMLNDPMLRRRMTEDAIRIREQIANLPVDTETVQVGQPRRSGGRAEVYLPTQINTPEAQDSIMHTIMQGGAQAEQVMHALTERVASADPSTPEGQADESAFRGILDTLKDQAPATPVARDIHNKLLDNLHARLEEGVLQVEQGAVESGQSGHDINLTVEQRIEHGANKIDNFGPKI